MKKYIIGILVVFAIIFSSVGVMDTSIAANSDDNVTEIQTFSKDGVVIEFPSDWAISQSSSNYSIMALSNSATVEDGISQVNINIEKKPIDGSFDSFVNTTYNSMEKEGSYNVTSSGEIALGSFQGLEYNYMSDINGTLKEHRAIWVESNGEAYVILYSAPVDQFDSNLKVFDSVLRTIQINA